MKKATFLTSILALAVPVVMVGTAQAAEPPAAPVNPDGSKI